MATHAEAMRRAKYGHRDWIAVPSEGGEAFEPISVSAIKRAMLAAGTRGKITVISGSTAVHYAHSWRIGVNMIRNARHLGIPS
jgi:hypothetical protein